MAYTRHNWVNNDVPAINQKRLNEIEAGIYNLHAVDVVIKEQLADVDLALLGIDGSIDSIKDVLDVASNDIALANEAVEETNYTSNWANDASATANQNSDSANFEIDTNRLLDAFDDILSVCKTKLSKQVDMEKPGEGDILNYYVCKYDAGKFIMYHRDWEPEEY